MFFKFVHVFIILVHMYISVVRGLKCMGREREALLSLKMGFKDDYGRLSSWGSRENQQECCNWVGVRCSNQTGNVVRLDLRNEVINGPRLKGIISPSLADLRYLNYLDLSFNLFPYIPKFFGSLTHLKYLNLSYNLILGGKIPHELGNLFRLKYLDLSMNRLIGEIPTQFSNLSCLEYLDLSHNHFTGEIPPQLGNFSHLRTLYIGNRDLRTDLGWLSYLSSSLTNLAIVEVDLSSVNNWLQLASNLPLLRELMFWSCNLTNNVSLSVSNANISNSLVYIDLSSNNLTSSIFTWLLNYKSSLVTTALDQNLIDGGLPGWLWDACNLRELYLFGNKLSGMLEDYFPKFPRCAQKSLEILYLSSNEIDGTMPDLSQLSSLRELSLSGNRINGTLSKSIGRLLELEALDVGRNNLEGVATEAHLSNLSGLSYLDLSDNNALVLNFSPTWVPPFQLEVIILSTCKLGSNIPSWLRTQKRFQRLEISSSNISGTIPHWFWNLPPTLTYLNLSHNQIRGQIPHIQVEFYERPEIDLSSNMFQGSVPSFASIPKRLILSDNQLTDSNSLLCTKKVKDLTYLDLSNNKLFELPDCFMNSKSLSFLNLANNNLTGEIPKSIGSLVQMEALHLRNNSLTGELPPSLSNCTQLKVFDVAHNKLFGPIPLWIGDKLQMLQVLTLKSNQFYGTLPVNICQLFQIQILDLSSNNFTGSIPKCINHFIALSNQTSPNAKIHYIYSPVGNNESYGWIYDDYAWLTWKGKEWEYSNTLGLMKSIDLSSNNFIGEIPNEIMDLVGLVSLNLSRNKLIGNIPSTIGELRSLDVLDLSWNLLSGRIPSNLSELHLLGVLNLSYNNLSGKIPDGTQLQSYDATSYMGNPELCGVPLIKLCPQEQTHNDQNESKNKDDNLVFDRGFYISIAFGFIVGFWGVCGSLVLIQSWRYAYFKLMTDIYNRFYVLGAVYYTRLRRKFNENEG